ncbi:MAG: SGNH/GDSL hydrolase family protein [Proteobacteria bacterium]|nr:SGNH/GDSL hydrolase family protein [Pseudomonadota bacterium]
MLTLLLACTAPSDTSVVPDLEDDGLVTPIHEDTSDDQEEGGGDTELDTDDTDDTEDPVDTATDTPTFEACFAEIAGEGDGGPDYDQFGPTVASHCSGTDHQDITGVERVVFLGDSVTVGTPPSADAEFYRNILADELATKFSLDAPDWTWTGVNLLEGTSYAIESGDFAHCAKWGARADDLMRDNSQVEDCLPEDQRDKVTLIVFTIGGNDLSNLTEGFMEGKSHEELWEQTRETMGLVRDTVEWIKEPGRFENGVYVVFTNLYEFTDATGDTASCPAAGLAGFGEAVTDPELEAMVVWSMEQFMSIAVDTDTDMLFLLETFCGHGFNYDDPDGRCYRGAEAELWFDLTCIHPNPVGHQVIADMFLDVVDE